MSTFFLQWMKPIGKISIAETLTAILSQSFTEAASHSGVICKRCVQLCANYELHRKQIDNIKQKISKDYNETMMHLSAAAIAQDPVIPTISSSDFNNRKFKIQANKTISIKQIEHSQRAPKKDVQSIIFLNQPDAGFQSNEPLTNDDGIMDEHQFVLSQVQSTDYTNFDDIQNTEMVQTISEENIQFLNSETVSDDTGSVICQYIASELSLKADDIKTKVLKENDLRIHKRSHCTTAKRWSCNSCSMNFASKYTLAVHQKIHSQQRERPYNCTKCSKSFYSSQNLIQHERTHSGLKQYVCTQCDKAFLTSHNLAAHQIIHTGYKPYICRTCGRAFARQSEINIHERTHTGERPFGCDICEAKFSQQSNLMSHKRATHLNEKRYKCDECAKSFKRRRLLGYHQKTKHTGERPYACDKCSSTFVAPEHYERHSRIHSGERPYKCEVCDKTFTSRDNRNAHLYVHSVKKPYECLKCGKEFMRKSLLLAHMKAKNHENEMIVINKLSFDTKDYTDANDYEPNELMPPVDYLFDTNKEVIVI